MLEEYVPTNNVVLRAFLGGAYYFSNRRFFEGFNCKTLLRVAAARFFCKEKYYCC